MILNFVDKKAYLDSAKLATELRKSGFDYEINEDVYQHIQFLYELMSEQQYNNEVDNRFTLIIEVVLFLVVIVILSIIS